MDLILPLELWAIVMDHLSPGFYPALVRAHPPLVRLLAPEKKLRTRFSLYSRHIQPKGLHLTFPRDDIDAATELVRIVFQHFEDYQLKHLIRHRARNFPCQFLLLARYRRTTCKQYVQPIYRRHPELDNERQNENEGEDENENFFSNCLNRDIISRAIAFCRKHTDQSMEQCPLAIAGNRLRRLNKNIVVNRPSRELSEIYQTLDSVLDYMVGLPLDRQLLLDIRELGCVFSFKPFPEYHFNIEAVRVGLEYGEDPTIVASWLLSVMERDTRLFQLFSSFGFLTNSFGRFLIKNLLFVGSIEYFFQNHPDILAEGLSELAIGAVRLRNVSVVDYMMANEALFEWLECECVKTFVHCAKVRLSPLSVKFCKQLYRKFRGKLCGDLMVLQWAARNGWLEIVGDIILHFDGLLPAKAKKVAMMWAKKAGHEEIVELLLSQKHKIG